MNAALRLGIWHALYTVAAALVLQFTIDAFAFECQDNLLETAELRRTVAENLSLPALGAGMVLVHFEQSAGEECRFVATGAGADFHDHARAVGIFAANRELQQLGPQRLAFGT